MPNRILKETIWTSPNLNQLSDLAEFYFYRILPLPDDHGCCELTPAVVKGRCFPLKPYVTIKMIQQWNQELEGVDVIRTWEKEGRLYACFPKWSKHQRIRSTHQRKTPEPPSDVITRRQLTASDGLNPNPNPNPSIISPSEIQQADSLFEKRKETRNGEKNRNISSTHLPIHAFAKEYKSRTGNPYLIKWEQFGNLSLQLLKKLKSVKDMNEQQAAEHVCTFIKAFFDQNEPKWWEFSGFISNFNKIQASVSTKQKGDSSIWEPHPLIVNN